MCVLYFVKNLLLLKFRQQLQKKFKILIKLLIYINYQEKN